LCRVTSSEREMKGLWSLITYIVHEYSLFGNEMQ